MGKKSIFSLDERAKLELWHEKLERHKGTGPNSLRFLLAGLIACIGEGMLFALAQAIQEAIAERIKRMPKPLEGEEDGQP